MNAAYLYDYLLTVLGDILGTYTYEGNGYQTAALCIGNQPDEVRVQGIEVVIGLVPDTIDRDIHSTGFVEKQRWTITVIDRGTGTDLPVLVDRLDKAFVRNRKKYFSPGRDTDYHQVVYQFVWFNGVDA